MATVRLRLLGLAVGALIVLAALPAPTGTAQPAGPPTPLDRPTSVAFTRVAPFPGPLAAGKVHATEVEVTFTYDYPSGAANPQGLDVNLFVTLEPEWAEAVVSPATLHFASPGPTTLPIQETRKATVYVITDPRAPGDTQGAVSLRAEMRGGTGARASSADALIEVSTLGVPLVPQAAPEEPEKPAPAVGVNVPEGPTGSLIGAALAWAMGVLFGVLGNPLRGRKGKGDE